MECPVENRIDDVVEVKAPVIDFVLGVLGLLTRLEPTLHSSVNGKKEFGRKEFVQCNIVLEALFVAGNHVVEVAQTFGEDALFAEENPCCLFEQLDLDPKAVNVGRYVD